jgi:O-antigen/teichoic acid export membrane protein
MNKEPSANSRSKVLDLRRTNSQDPRTKIQELARFSRHPLISGSAVLFVGSMAGNVFHFLFNVFMSRNLSVIEYGILVSLTTLAFLPGFFFHSIIPTTVSFATTFIANKEYGKLKGLFIKINLVMISAGLIFAFLFMAFTEQIAGFLNIINIEKFVSFLGIIIFFSLISNVNLAFLQAKLAFRYTSFVTFMGGFLKFLFGIGFIYAGFRVGGVLVGLIASNIFVLIIGFLPLVNILQTKTRAIKMETGKLLNFGAPATIALLSVASLINMDIIMIKHLLPAHEAGLYAGLSLIGKVIFYFSAPIGSVMFPLIVKKHTLGERKEKTLIASIGLVLIPSILLTLFYFIAPNFTINFFLKREEYQALSSVLGFFGVFMSFYAILHILTNYFLSIKKTKIYIPLAAGAILQIIMISLYHKSFIQIITISASITLLLIVCLLIYYPHAENQKT